MLRNLLQPLVALLLSCLLVCPPSLAQGRQNSSSQADPQAQVKPDLKRAKKLMELGAKEEAAGAYEEALAAYDEAVRYAPFDVTIVGKAAALRSKLVQSYVDKAELLAVQGNFLEATEQLASALQVDPSNTMLLERLKQLNSLRVEAKNAEPEEPPEGMPQLAPAREKRIFVCKRICRAPTNR